MTSFERKFQAFVELCTEDYLIRHANKGLYKRSLKDIAQGVSVKYEWGETTVTCHLGDGITCTLESTLDHWNCSCPSDHLCKHVLISILYYQQTHAAAEVPADKAHDVNPEQALTEAESGSVKTHVATDGADREDTAAPESRSRSRFEWMLHADLLALIQSYSASALEEVMFRLSYPEDIEVIHDSLLTVRLVRQNIEVSFTEEPGLSKALCKVKQAAGNMAKLEALLRYRKKHGLHDADTLGGKAYEAKFSLETVKECRRMLAEMLRVGLARLPESYMAQLETLAITAHSGNLPDIERSLRGIQGELQLFLTRHIRFSMPTMLDRVTKLYLALQVLEQKQVSTMQQSQLIGSFRSKYYTVPDLHLYGLGADAWETQSGYRGITYYFYGLQDQQMYTFSDVRAVYYDQQQFQFEDHYRSTIPWLPNVSYRQFAGEELCFHGIKVNEDRRLSSGEGAKLKLLTRRPVEEMDFGPFTQEFSALSNSGGPRSYQLFSMPQEQLALVKVTRVFDQAYDKQKQELTLTVESDRGELLDLSFPYDKDWSTMISRLESGHGIAKLEHFFVFMRVEAGRLRPISFLKGQQVINLKLDAGYGRMGRFARI
ncbi:hypothetical protein [Paenibacillus hubeiensis]|uniref:hypothetical protein n=1 Tax=Paenibacillus hubeiensis TaxID=3077330 RepID=UPI0031BA0237